MSGPSTVARTAIIVRVAEPGDAVVPAVRALLAELGATGTERVGVESAFEAILAHPREATALLALEAGERIVGLLGASWPLALRAGGRYGLIQELWVSPERRGREIGGQLIEALVEQAARRRIATLEVGLPRDGFAALGRTRAFYMRHGFQALGSRLRRRVP